MIKLSEGAITTDCSDLGELGSQTLVIIYNLYAEAYKHGRQVAISIFAALFEFLLTSCPPDMPDASEDMTLALDDALDELEKMQEEGPMPS